MSKLTVFTGSMFAGKSTALVEAGKKESEEGKTVLFIKPTLDSRYSENEIVTHDGESVRAMVIDHDTQMDIIDFFAIIGADVVLFDEVQFFTDDLVEMVSDLVGDGKTVYVAGLNSDYKLKPFKTTTKLMEIADEVKVLTAVCADCAKQGATVTIKTSGSDDRIELGSEDIYKPVCHECYLISVASFKGGDK
ncbi:thymidine kinase [Bacillus subtilis]|uniref:thymidine kinase n=1 Tax=Bacillus subtilis TaxID=1423 RepID=UPI00129DF46F|nr:thymidine kinase [Bacillus subtilis]NRF01906.1 thymidine kinase [Bacillus subtilis]NRG37188.1 thymidine kinase [Bacillus subtilis]QGI31238.1 thymidine kinase [Bacillus subtilis]WHX51892.1 thymidine kinase [Bacillus subtilis]WHX55894.1 thymidine kinase [Bacillus subtilis]